MGSAISSLIKNKSSFNFILRTLFYFFIGLTAVSFLSLLVIFTSLKALFDPKNLLKTETQRSIGFDYTVHESGEHGNYSREYIFPTSGTKTQMFSEHGFAGSKHYGWDIANSEYSITPIKNFSEGEVVLIEENILKDSYLDWEWCGESGKVCWFFVDTPRDVQHSYGNVIVVEHGENIRSLYGHLDSINVEVGERIKMEKTIGNMGSTGFSTGKHLHFEIRHKVNNHIDPKYAFE